MCIKNLIMHKKFNSSFVDIDLTFFTVTPFKGTKNHTYPETTAVRILATEPVYSLTILSKYFRIDATTMPPSDANNMATIKIPNTCELRPKNNGN